MSMLLRSGVGTLLISFILFAAVVGLVPAASFSEEPEPALPTESSLEPEFTQLRAKLSALPEFSGPDANSKFKLAEELARRGDVQGAIENYRAAIHLKADWADPWRGLGQVLLGHHDYAEAVQALQASIRLGRDDHQAFYWLGRAFMGKGDLPAASLALIRATELKPDDAEAYADLALVRMAEGDIEKARMAVTESINLKPDYAEAHRLREVLDKNGKDSAAVTQVARAILKDLFERE